jgi:N-acetylmuramoyl-L-alanine amidase
VGWRQHISREALSGSLDSFQATSWPTGTGSAKTFSKLKSGVKPTLSRKKFQVIVHKLKQVKLSDAVRAYQSIIKLSQRLAVVTSKPRVLVHGVVVLGVITVLVGSNLTSLTTRTALVSQLSQNTTGYGSSMDAVSQVEVAAHLAAGTHMLVSADATTAASKLTSQVDLAGSDLALAKRQIVATTQPASHTVKEYVVQSGDSLSQIAAKFNITSDTIRWANNLKDVDSLTPGQSLKILPVTGVLHVIQAGDTSASLAAKFQANEAQIIEYNDADVKGLAAGQQVIIPDGVIYEAPKPAPIAVVAAASSISSTPSVSYSFVGGNNTYAWGNCTWYVASRRSIPPFWGNARDWYYNAQYSGYSVGSVPAVGAIAWTGAGYYGHVGYVESVSGGMVTISEMNYGGNFGRMTYRTTSASSFRYIY